MKKTILNLFVIYHVLVVVLSPNITSDLGSKFSPFISVYAGIFGLGSTWSFFAPDPGPPPLFLEWEILGEQNAVVGLGQIPEKSSPFWLVERQNRRFVLVRNLYLDHGRHLIVMGNYLCRLYPKSSGVRLWKSIHTVPTHHEVQSGQRKIDDEFGVLRSSVGTHFCERDLHT
jgi:hypothetical protein